MRRVPLHDDGPSPVRVRVPLPRMPAAERIRVQRVGDRARRGPVGDGTGHNLAARGTGQSPLEANLCSVCGVRLFHRAVPPEAIVRIKVGTLDDTSWFHPAAEFFTTRRRSWVDLGDTTVECPERAEDQAALLAAWQRLFPPA